MSLISDRERLKYERIWQSGCYEKDQGPSYIDLFLEIANPPQGASIIDIGAGSGAASKLLMERGFRVTAFDITDAGWQHSDVPMLHGNIWEAWNAGDFDYGFCCDVMEHIPTELIGLSLHRILSVCSHAFFNISFEPDIHGAAIRDTLHLTVKPFLWWRDLFRELGNLEEARDCLGRGIFYVS